MSKTKSTPKVRKIVLELTPEQARILRDGATDKVKKWNPFVDLFEQRAWQKLYGALKDQ